jgi:hypothetical protein
MLHARMWDIILKKERIIVYVNVAWEWISKIWSGIIVYVIVTCKIVRYNPEKIKDNCLCKCCMRENFENMEWDNCLCKCYVQECEI